MYLAHPWQLRPCAPLASTPRIRWRPITWRGRTSYSFISIPRAMVYSPAKTLYPWPASVSSCFRRPFLGTRSTVMNSLPSNACVGLAFSGASRFTSTRTMHTVSLVRPGDRGSAGVTAPSPTVPTYPVSSLSSRRAARSGGSVPSISPAGSSMVSPLMGGRNCRTRSIVSSSPSFRSVAKMHTASAAAPSAPVARPTISQLRSLPVGSTYVRCLKASHLVP
mmetsp:Transcript_18134/g.45026  ORF Transcript_18134/g.45026 Transcript_18134/m.45026 type:complete len:221 (+) Transcript_18134:214-876(+)